VACTALSACQPDPQPHSGHHTKQITLHHGLNVAVFRAHVAEAAASRDDSRDADYRNDWIYYYLILDSSNRPVYYASSSTPISDFRSASFTKMDEKLPAEIEEAVENGEHLETQQMEPAQEPAEVQAELDTTQQQIEVMENEGGPPAPEVSAGESATVEPAPSDSGNSGGGDSGGGDGGGGGSSD
jgi:hypothetical protein